MYKKLRIVCTIIAALFLAVILPAATLGGLNGLIICGFGAGLFFFLTLIFRKAQQKQDEKNGVAPQKDNFDEDFAANANDNTDKNDTANSNQNEDNPS